MIESRINSTLKYLLKLEQKKYRDINKEYLIFGDHIVCEASNSTYLKKIILSLEKYEKIKNSNILKKYDYEIMKKNLFKEFKSLKNPPEIIGLCQQEEGFIDSGKILALDQLSDPGNVGTLIRTAKAFGIDNVVLNMNSVDIYNPKVIQAMQGVHFKMNIRYVYLIDFLKGKKNIITTYLNEKSTITLKNYEEFILLLGNEAQGLNDEYKKFKHENYRIDIKYESLNVSQAGAIMMYELTKGEI